ncbi:MAG: hypothetical protein M3540_06900 [Actinomycetota bacterium]|nr:hypothetical protein [Actinomycetota bacterium]
MNRYREIAAARRDEFVAKGFKQRHFFPHRVYHLPKCGPDGFRLAERMCGRSEPDQLWEIVLYADSSLLADLPRELFFDDDLLWHQQHFGRLGQVAAVNLVLDGRDLYTSAHQSDLVQRISRRREHKTQIEKRFKGWNQMLLNAALAFALEHGATRVHTPTAKLALEHTDPGRVIGAALFERVYDGDVQRLYSARNDGKWWTVDVQENRDRVVVPEPGSDALPAEKTIAVCHDLERGWGFVDTDPAFAKAAEKPSRASLDEMLAIEREAGVTATYCVVGAFMGEVRSKLEADGHCIAFHSYDHRLDDDQLGHCRQVDYRLKGYRPPKSRITPELDDDSLCFHNFEWLASSTRSLGIELPELRRRLVRIPILLDDHSLYTRAKTYDEWERDAFEQIEGHEFAAVSLHDCHAPVWLPRYRRFLEKLTRLGRLRTLDEVAGDVTLAGAT